MSAEPPVRRREGAHIDWVLSEETLTAVGDLLRALAAPVRMAIVLQLRDSDRSVHELVKTLGASQPLISQHLKVLRSAGVVRRDRDGRSVTFGLVDDHLAHIVAAAVSHVDERRR